MPLETLFRPLSHVGDLAYTRTQETVWRFNNSFYSDVPRHQPRALAVLFHANPIHMCRRITRPINLPLLSYSLQHTHPNLASLYPPTPLKCHKSNKEHLLEYNNAECKRGPGLIYVTATRIPGAQLTSAARHVSSCFVPGGSQRPLLAPRGWLPGPAASLRFSSAEPFAVA